jgi:electron transport complex protein RnfA
MNIGQLISIAISAILVENFVLVKFLGICPFIGVSKKPDTAFGMGCAVVFVITLASMLCWAMNTFLLIPFNLEYLQTIAFILVIATLVQFVEMVLKKLLPALYQALGIYLPLITTNCAVLGVAVLNVQREYDFIGSVVNGFSAAVGFMLAIVLFSGVRMRLETSDYPKCFEGFPIALISAALMSLAFLGFQGLSIG